MLRALIAAILTLWCCLAAGQAAAQDAIGTVSRIQGDASGTRGTTTQALGANTSVYPNEVVSTGDGTRLEITFKDNTRLTLSEKVKLTIEPTYSIRPRASARSSSKWPARSASCRADCRSSPGPMSA